MEKSTYTVDKIKVAIVGSLKSSRVLPAIAATLADFEIPHGIVHAPLGKARGISTASIAEWVAGIERAGARIFIAPILPGERSSMAAALASATSKPVLAFLDCGEDVADPDEVARALATKGAPPFAMLAVGEAGAKNAALMAVQILALDSPEIAGRLTAFRQRQSAAVLSATLPAL